MASKVILYNNKTGEIKSSGAKVEGNVYQGYLSKGFVAIGFASGMNLSVWGMDKERKDEYNKKIKIK